MSGIFVEILLHAQRRTMRHFARMASIDTAPAALYQQIQETPEAILQRELELSDTVGEYHERVAKVLQVENADPKVTEVAETTKENLEGIMKGHKNVKIENLPAGIQGVNYDLGTDDTAISENMLTPQALREAKAKAEAEEALDHENSPETGHRGQQKDLEGIILPDEAQGEQVLEGTELLEGEVEAQQGLDKRGREDAAREGQPEKDYGSGQRKVARVGLKIVGGYVRKGVSREQTQAEIFKKKGTPRLQMIKLMQGANFSEDQMEQVLAAA